ncbi:MAG: Methylated-DNA--protein-cysteine methyltransferase, partial [uncultured Friedmanniella sp.]
CSSSASAAPRWAPSGCSPDPQACARWAGGWSAGTPPPSWTRPSSGCSTSCGSTSPDIASPSTCHWTCLGCRRRPWPCWRRCRPSRTARRSPTPSWPPAAAPACRPARSAPSWGLT